MEKRIDVVRVEEEAGLQQAFAIRHDVFVGEQGVDRALEFDGLDDRCEHLLAILEGRPVGALRLRPIDERTGKIERVAVLASARGHRAGAALIRTAILHLRERGLRIAKLHAQTTALGFYEKLGFTAEGDVFEEDGILHRTMAMDLSRDLGAAIEP